MSGTSDKPTPFTFPHTTLTKIVGKPTATALTILKQQIYANARSVASTRGGGQRGHLGLVMTVAEYTALPNVGAANAFALPAHPGPTPVIPNGATQAQIVEANRQYNATLAELALADQVRTQLKNLIFQAVEDRYTAVLKDEVFGYADVEIHAIITHLVDEYGQLTRDDLETNRESIKTCWNPDEPIEDLWIRLQEIRRISIRGNDEITANTLMELTFKMFENTGVFADACVLWENRPEADRTYANLVTFFTEWNKIRIRKLTARQAGFHGANATTVATTPTRGATNAMEGLSVLSPMTGSDNSGTTETAAAASSGNTSTSSPHVTTNDGLLMYYCHTHGLGTNANHTSATCNRPAEGHQREATVSNMMGGNNKIMTGGIRRPRRRQQQQQQDS